MNETISELGWIYLALGIVFALLLVKRGIEYLCAQLEFRKLGIIKPVPFEVLRHIWETHAETFLRIAAAEDKDSRNWDFYNFTETLKQDYPELWLPIYSRGDTLLSLYQDHPDLFAPWIQEGQAPAHLFHPAILYAAATIPAHLDDGFSDFKPANFSKLVQQTAAQMEAGETTP